MRVGILTGTFDPVHLGHVELALAAQQAANLSEVWFLVNPAPGHKSDALPYGHRLAMVELAVAGYPSLRPGVATTHTLPGFKSLMDRFAGNQFVFIVGMDTIARLDEWDDPAAIVGSQAFMVAHRPDASVAALEQLRRRLGALGADLEARLFDFTDHDRASSTAIRQALRAGEPTGSLSPAVREYVKAHELYH